MLRPEVNMKGATARAFAMHSIHPHTNKHECILVPTNWMGNIKKKCNSICVCLLMMCANMCPFLFCRNRALDPSVQSRGHCRLFTADLWPRPERTNRGRKVMAPSSITIWNLIRTQSMCLIIRTSVFQCQMFWQCVCKAIHSSFTIFSATLNWHPLRKCHNCQVSHD